MSHSSDIYPQDGRFPLNDGLSSLAEIFVFGSNEAGRHGKGAALHAKQHCGAIYGQGVGFQGRSYAIPTKDRNLLVLPLARIEQYVTEFLAFAADHPLCEFRVTEVGCGLAGYRPSQVAPFFEGAPPNVLLPPEFQRIIAGRR